MDVCLWMSVYGCLFMDAGLAWSVALAGVRSRNWHRHLLAIHLPCVTLVDDRLRTVVGKLRYQRSESRRKNGERDVEDYSLPCACGTACFSGFTYDASLPHHVEQCAERESHHGREYRFEDFVSERVGVVDSVRAHGVYFLVDSVQGLYGAVRSGSEVWHLTHTFQCSACGTFVLWSCKEVLTTIRVKTRVERTRLAVRFD